MYRGAKRSSHGGLWTHLLQELYPGLVGPGEGEGGVQLPSVQGELHREARSEEEQHAEEVRRVLTCS